MDSKLVAPAPA
jgi:5'-AMP-activated protein kinase, catalytic alpha subunit